MDAQKEAFKEEAYDLLAGLEASLMELEEMPDNIEQIDSAFRALHTIKGSGAMFGFDDIADFTHNIETVFELVREGSVKMSRDLVSLTLSTCDQIKDMLDAHCGGEPPDGDRAVEIIAAIREFIPDRDGISNDRGRNREINSEVLSGAIATYRINFRPSVDIFKTGSNPVHLLNELRKMGGCDITINLDAVPLLKDCDHDACYVSWDIVITTDKSINALKDVFIFVETVSEITFEPIEEGRFVHENIDDGRTDGIEAYRAAIAMDNPEPLIKSRVSAGGSGSNAASAGRHMESIYEHHKKNWRVSSIRVPAEKLDSLVDLVGELVTVQARLSQKASDENDPALKLIAEDVENLTNGLRDNTMSIRMVQIGSTFTGFRRFVRDLSRELGKDVALFTEGGNTELDKTVIDKLNDPMVHIMRNCIDHGIEPPDIREASGKPRRGVIKLSAEHAGGNVLIRISDDGAGIDIDAVHSKAVKKGIITSECELPDNEILQLIFSPGFSTAKKITGISGRGVGLDVVKRNVESLRGSVETTSKKGAGTTIILKLPLTLAIIEGLLVGLGNDKYIMPLLSVDECVELTRADSDKARGRDILNVRGEMVPYIRLRKSFKIEGESPELEHVVITNINGDRIGFVVDEVIGGHQTVIKPLGRGMKQSEDISGATILGDGSVALILDIDRLLL